MKQSGIPESWLVFYIYIFIQSRWQLNFFRIIKLIIENFSSENSTKVSFILINLTIYSFEKYERYVCYEFTSKYGLVEIYFVERNIIIFIIVIINVEFLCEGTAKMSKEIQYILMTEYWTDNILFIKSIEGYINSEKVNDASSVKNFIHWNSESYSIILPYRRLCIWAFQRSNKRMFWSY